MSEDPETSGLGKGNQNATISVVRSSIKHSNSPTKVNIQTLVLSVVSPLYY